MRRTALQGAALVAAILVIGSGARSFSAQRAGFGIETPGGYRVSNVKYWLGGESTVRAIAFNLDASAQTVSARIVIDGPWYQCTSKGDTSWSCPVPEGAPVDMNDADTFQVRAR